MAQLTKLFVGNLLYSTTEPDLYELFGNFGEVISARVISDKVTGLSKGYGFVEFEDPRSAIAARDRLNGHPLRPNHNMVVDLARPSAPRGQRR